MNNTPAEFVAFPTEVQDKLAAQQPANPPPFVKRKLASPQATIKPEVPNQASRVIHPGFTNPTSDPEAISIDLPSRFAFYDFKDLYVKPFRAFHLAKLSKAHEDRSLMPMVEAVSSVLSTSLNGVSNLGFKLCVNDFYFVLYWLKMHSFTKATLVNTNYCINPEHFAKVERKELPEESLKIMTTVTSSDLKITNLENLPDVERFVLPAPFYCRPATMQDSVEFMENPNWLDAEFQYLGKLASNFSSRNNPGISLLERIEILKNFDGDTCLMLEDYEKAIDCFGVEEKIILNCSVCGASRESKLSLDAHSFLSINQ